MTRLLLSFTPFHPCTSPPYGLACLKAALSPVSNVEAKCVDWNLAFYRRWLLGDAPELCGLRSDQLLGQVCPTELCRQEGEAIWRGLTTTPTSAKEVEDYIVAAKRFDGIYADLRSYYQRLLTPFVEGREMFSDAELELIFADELAEVAEFSPNVVGFSLLSEANLLYSLALARAIESHFGARIVFGGAMTSHLDPQALLRLFPWIDFVLPGEADLSIVDLAEMIEAGAEDTALVGGLVSKEGVSSKPPSCPNVLGELPFADFSDFSLDDYLCPAPVLPIITSRGCYWGKCVFCSHTLPYAPGVRLRPVDAVADEIAHQQQRHDVKHFLFVDEAVAPKTLAALSDEILARGLDVRWGAEGIRIEKKLDRALLTKAHDAGLRWIYVGVESANQRLLDGMEKGISNAEIPRVIEDCRTAGVLPQLSFIVGFPSTTTAELASEIDFLVENDVDHSVFALLKGSPIEREASTFGVEVGAPVVLFRTIHGELFAPRFNFVVTYGMSPQVASQIVEEELAERKGEPRRPHLGEVHALVLAGAGFFAERSRPAPPASIAERSLIALGEVDESARDVRWTLHLAACLEVLGDIGNASEVLQAPSTPPAENETVELLLHLVALANHAHRPDLVFAVIGQLIDDDSRLPPRVQAEVFRASFEQKDYARTLEIARRLEEASFDAPWVHPIVATAHEVLGDPETALGAYRRAESYFWRDSTLNESQARCLGELGREQEAEEQRVLAQKKGQNFPG